MRDATQEFRGSQQGMDDVIVRFRLDGEVRYTLTFAGKGARERADRAVSEWEIGEALWVQQVLERGACQMQ